MRRSRPLSAGTGARRSTSAVTASALPTMAPGGVGGCRYGASTEIGQTFQADNKCHRTARGTWLEKTRFSEKALHPPSVLSATRRMVPLGHRSHDVRIWEA